MKRSERKQNLAFGLYFLIVVSFAILRTLSSFGVFNFMGKYASYVFSLIAQVGILFSISVFLFSYIRKQKLKRTFLKYRFKKFSSEAVVVCILLGVVVFFLNMFVSSFFNSIITFLGYSPNRGVSTVQSYTVWLLLINIFFSAVLPAICEEVAHRGMLLNCSQKWGAGKAILISSLLFGAIHMNIEQFFYATLFGVFFGYITLATDSIYPAIIIHFINNALSILLTFSVVNGYALADIFYWLDAILINQAIAGVLLIVCIGILLLYIAKNLIRKLRYYTLKSKFVETQNEIGKFVQKHDFLHNTSLSTQKQNISFKINFESFKAKKIPTLSKIFITFSLIISLAVTIFTFVWGII